MTMYDYINNERRTIKKTEIYRTLNNSQTMVKQWSLNCMLTFNNCITMNDNCMTIE